MIEQNLLREAFQHRYERLQELKKTGRNKERRPSSKERLEKDSRLAESVEQVREMLKEVPDIRKDRVAAIKKQLKEGSLELNSKAVADNLLQDSVLNELL